MADEVADPLEAAAASLAESHVKLMDDIFRHGLDQSRELCDEALTSIRKKSGQKSAMLDSALTKLGITEPQG